MTEKKKWYFADKQTIQYTQHNKHLQTNISFF